MAPPTTTAPLPVAANRAALANRIALSLSTQLSVLKSMNTSRPTNTGVKRRHVIPRDDDDDDLRAPELNAGLGYVPDKASVDTKRNDQALRGRLLGKRKAGDPRGKKGRAVVESESDEDEGRTALGKRKRPRRVPQPGDDREMPAVEDLGLTEDTGGVGEEAIQKEVADKTGESPSEVAVIGEKEVTSDSARLDDISADVAEGGQNKKRRKNKKKKNKNKQSQGAQSL